MKQSFLFLVSLTSILSVHAQTATVGLIEQQPGNQPGTVLFAPIANTTTYLIDKCGNELHEWPSTYQPGLSVYLLEDGTLLRAGNTHNTAFSTGGGAGGSIEKIDWNGTVTWSYLLSSTTQCQHHDICPLPNGNVLALVWEIKNRSQAILAGRDTSYLNANLWNEKIVELQPSGTSSATVVWEWNSWDHLIQDFDNTKNNFGIVADHPELININANFTGSHMADWLHLNSIDYNPDLDQILVSSRLLNEVLVIDHSTTTATAATHTGGNHNKGGDLLYRWGNPQAYGRGTVSDQHFFGQHCARWIKNGLSDAGKIMVFNNGKNRPGGDYSSIDVIAPPVDGSGNYTLPAGLAYGPASLFWTYQAAVPGDFFENNISGATRLPNGNTLICKGNAGEFFEIDSSAQTVWYYVSPVDGAGPVTQGSTPALSNVFRTEFYAEDYPAFAVHPLVPGNPIEINPLVYSCDAPLSVNMAAKNLATTEAFPNPTRSTLTVQLQNYTQAQISYSCYSYTGELISTGTTNQSTVVLQCNDWKPGLYLLCIQTNGKLEQLKFIKQ